MTDTPYDLAIVGGGINGAGIARDAAGRGLKVVLCEQDDLASATSNWSTKLIHGGLRYLEYYEFRLVREALIEREVLWGMAPHIVSPLRLVLPHHTGLRPAWLLRLGLLLYDTLGGRKRLPGTRTLDLTRDDAGRPLKPGLFRRGYEFSDCRVDDARLVVLNAQDAAARGARIMTRTRCTAARRVGALWDIDLTPANGGVGETVRAKAVVNAAGPWVDRVLHGTFHGRGQAKVRLVQGSHIVTRRLFDHDRAYFFQNADGRIMFAIPYQDDFTLIGTTDRDYAGEPGDVRITAEETAYLCEAASAYFSLPVTPTDVVWAYSGVRPLYDDGASEAKAATRDYVFELDVAQGEAPLLSIFGGKITTYRRLAEQAMERLGGTLGGVYGAAHSWTAGAVLPGGDGGIDAHALLPRALAAEHPFLPDALARRLSNTYGTRARMILAGARSMDDLGRDFGAGLTEAEVAYLREHEWAMSADDILWRRTKMGLRLTKEQQVALRHAMGA